MDVAGEVVANLVEGYLLANETPAIEDWMVLLADMRTMTLTANLETKEYWTDLYRARLETAVALGADSAVELARVVDELAKSERDSLFFVMLSHSGFGYLIWLYPDLSAVASCIRARDKRIR